MLVFKRLNLASCAQIDLKFGRRFGNVSISQKYDVHSMFIGLEMFLYRKNMMFTICFECFLVNVSGRLIFTIISTLWRPECTKDIKARSCAPSPEVGIRLNDEDFYPVSPGWLCTELQLGSAIQRKCRQIKQP